MVFFITAGSLTYILYGRNEEVLPTQAQNINTDQASVFGKFLAEIKQNVIELDLGGNKTQFDTEFSALTSEVSKVNGSFSIYIKNKSTNQEYLYNAEKEYYSASLFKIIVAQATFTKVKNGTLALDNKVALMSEDFSSGTGTIQSSSVGTEFTLDYVLDRLLKDSDNTAQNMLLRYVSNAGLNEEFTSLPPNNSFLSQNIASPKEVSEFINILYPEVLQKMEQTSFDNRITAGLAEDIIFSHKIGNWNDTWHDCGVAKKDEKEVIVCVMSGNTSFENFQVVTRKVGEFVNNLLI